MRLTPLGKVREAALDAAYDDIRHTGDTSMRRVASTVGISAPALYHHFAGKADLLEQVAERAFSAFGQRLKPEHGEDPPATVRRIIEVYRDFAMGEPALFTLLFVERRSSARKFPREFAEHRSAVFNILWNAVERCGATAIGEAEALYLAHDLWALAHGHILLWRAGRFEDDATFVSVLDRSVDHFIASL
jgi:AcrR family transcriptional regulator